MAVAAQAVDRCWEWPFLVFRKLDARSLAAASCACTSWKEVAAQEDLWRSLCTREWPGLVASRCGMSAVKSAGGYRKFYSIRQRALQFSCASNRRAKLGYKPSLKLKDILFMLDVNHHESPVCSFVRGVESLRPMFPASSCTDEEQGTFRFVVSVHQDAVHPEEHEVWIGGQKWNKQEVREFSVSWAVMIKGGPKMFQILHTRQPGQVLGNTCNYAERLPIHSCCCFSETNHVAEVDLYFSEDEPEEEEGRDEHSLFLRELRCSILNTDCWRYFTQAQALQYLQHALLHDCLYN